MQTEQPNIDPKDDAKIREIEERKLSLQSKIIELKAEVFKLDHEMFAAGASTERINRTLRW